MDVSQVIAVLGGYRQTARLLGVKRSTLALWEVEGIPAKRWDQVAEISTRFAETPITLEMLSEVLPSKPAVEQNEAA